MKESRFAQLTASSWGDWSGFFLWAAKLAVVVLVLFGISFAADWTTLRLFGSRSSDLSFVATQALDAVFNGLAFAIAVTLLLPKVGLRERLRFPFASLWLGFTSISFINVVHLPIPLWQAVVTKIALFSIGAAVLWITRRRWTVAPRPPTDSEEHSHA